MTKTTRNYGVDLLRLVCMLGVVCLHLLGHGGALDATQSHLGFSAAWFLKALAQPAVNCYVLISGFVGYREARYYPKLKNILSLTFSALFFSVGIGLMFKLLYPASFGTKDLLHSCILVKQYWFFDAYLGMILLSPLLNIFVHKGDKKLHFIFLLVVVLFSFVSLFVDVFTISRGYSAFWFLLLYALGAMIKKYDLPGKLSNKGWFLVGLGALMVNWLPIAILPLANISVLTEYCDLFATYISITTVLMAVCWLCLFSKLPCKKAITSAVAFVTPSVFSVYLIHDNLYIRQRWISQFSTLCSSMNPAVLIAFILGCALVIFLVCILIDLIRRLLFRLVRLDNLAEKLADWIRSIVLTLYRKLPF